MRSSGTGSINLFSHRNCPTHVQCNVFCPTVPFILALVSQASFTPWMRAAHFTKFKYMPIPHLCWQREMEDLAPLQPKAEGSLQIGTPLSHPGLSQWGESNFPKFGLSGARKREWMQNEEGHTMANVHSRSWGTGDRNLAQLIYHKSLKTLP